MALNSSMEGLSPPVMSWREMATLAPAETTAPASTSATSGLDHARLSAITSGRATSDTRKNR